MQPVYFAHGYRKREAPFAAFFGKLLRRQGLLPSLDPPSEVVNSAKLERHLRFTKGLVAIVADRGGKISPHIRFEIYMSIRLGQPLLAFFEDTLAPDVLPAQILKRRFSSTSFIREYREHMHAIEILSSFLGPDNVPKYIAPDDHRTCLLIGATKMPVSYRDGMNSLLMRKGYEVINIPSGAIKIETDSRVIHRIRQADLAIALLDDKTPSSMYYLGLSRACLIPTILFTMMPNYPISDFIPKEYQRIYLPSDNVENGISIVEKNIELFEEDFVDLDRDSEAEEYANQLASISSSDGKYSDNDRKTIIMGMVMGDVYNTGQAGSVGPGSSSSMNNFNQIWQQHSGQIDLPQLSRELGELRAAMRAGAEGAEHDVSIGAVAAAQVAADNGDGPGALSHLKAAGNWALDVATKIGVGVAVAAIKSSTGL